MLDEFCKSFPRHRSVAWRWIGQRNADPDSFTKQIEAATSASGFTAAPEASTDHIECKIIESSDETTWASIRLDLDCAALPWVRSILRSLGQPAYVLTKRVELIEPDHSTPFAHTTITQHDDGDTGSSISSLIPPQIALPPSATRTSAFECVDCELGDTPPLYFGRPDGDSYSYAVRTLYLLPPLSTLPDPHPEWIDRLKSNDVARIYYKETDAFDIHFSDDSAPPLLSLNTATMASIEHEARLFEQDGIFQGIIKSYSSITNLLADLLREACRETSRANAQPGNSTHEGAGEEPGTTETTTPTSGSLWSAQPPEREPTSSRFAAPEPLTVTKKQTSESDSAIPSSPTTSADQTESDAEGAPVSEPDALGTYPYIEPPQSFGTRVLFQPSEASKLALTLSALLDNHTPPLWDDAAREVEHLVELIESGNRFLDLLLNRAAAFDAICATRSREACDGLLHSDHLEGGVVDIDFTKLFQQSDDDTAAYLFVRSVILTISSCTHLNFLPFMVDDGDLRTIEIHEAVDAIDKLADESGVDSADLTNTTFEIRSLFDKAFDPSLFDMSLAKFWSIYHRPTRPSPAQATLSAGDLISTLSRPQGEPQNSSIEKLPDPSELPLDLLLKAANRLL